MATEGKRSTLGLTVLGILAGEPMHAYRIQQLIRDYGKDRVVNVRQRASVYQAIDRLLRLGLIAVEGVGRDGARPERVVYAITEAGLATARTWIREMLSTVGGEFPEFPVALSFLIMLPPPEALAELEARLAAVEAELADVRAAVDQSADLPRIFLVEEEYRHAVLAAEQAWLITMIADLRDGKLTWSREWVQQIAAEFNERQDSERQEREGR
ncbi:PadR family transcriptional regulator [Nonomuraea sp. NPDC005983]|uniref:PadR family transcriptional regulator n=1 Tax=Nonomuraea sp. NPDC005983 TaxID=3155595 RepID=UPI0033A32108